MRLSELELEKTIPKIIYTKSSVYDIIDNAVGKDIVITPFSYVGDVLNLLKSNIFYKENTMSARTSLAGDRGRIWSR